MKTNIYLRSLLLITVLLLAANLLLQAGTEKPSYAAESKVYKVIPLSGISDLEKGINKYAAEGWTLLEVDGDTGNLIFYK